MKKNKTLLLVLMLIFVSLTFAGCRGTGAVASSWPGITVDGDTAYVAYNASIYTIDLSQRGNLERTAPTNDKDLRGHTFFHAPVLLGDQTLLVGSYKNSMYTIDSSGAATEFFAEAKNRWIATPLKTENAIYAPNANGTLYALDFDGSVIWEFPTEAAIWATPVKDNGSLYVVSQDHIMYKLDADSGEQVWALDLGASSVNSPALDDNGILYIGTFNSELLAVDSKLGKIIWHLNTNDWVWGSPTLGPDNTLFVTDLGGNLYAVDTEAGKFLWEKEVDAETSIAGSVLIVNDSLFVVTSNGAIVSYGLDGERLWKENIGSEDNPVEFYGTPILAGEDLILVSSTGSDNLVYAFNTQLETQWTFEPGK